MQSRTAESHARLSAPEIARCDCGRPRDRGADACSTCVWLDGATPAEQRVIAALRALGGAGTRAALELETEMPCGSLKRTLARLRRLGRLVCELERDEFGGERRATYRLASKSVGV